jgi:hypothetical protein
VIGRARYAARFFSPWLAWQSRDTHRKISASEWCIRISPCKVEFSEYLLAAASSDAPGFLIYKGSTYE